MTMESTDEALQRLGKWGKWQILLYIVISLGATWPSSWHMLAIVFLGGIPDHHCRLPEGADANTSIPQNKDGTLSSCEMYSNISSGNKTISCPNGYEYYGDIGSTIVSQWDLVCGRDYMVETSQTVMVIGVLIGAMGFTALSDNIGRKPVFIFSHLAMVVVGVITAFCYNYYLFVVLRFFAGALQQGIILTGFVMACELFPAEMRTFAGMAIEDFWAVGMCILALLAYLIRNWMHLQLVITIPGILTISYIWILPETIPWLVANDKFEEAEKIIQNAAKFNGVQVPENIFTSPETESEHMLKNNDGHKEKGEMNNVKAKKSIFDKFKKKPKKAKEEHEHHTAKYTLLDVLKNRTLCVYAIIMCLLWLVNSLVYYGLSLSTAALAGDRYLNFFFSGLVEIPAYTVSIFVLQRFGRRWPLVIFHIIAGVALCITMFIPEKLENGTSLLPLIITLNMIGKFGITGSFGVVFLYAPEIFPTTLRAQAMGISSVGGRIGNMLAPFSSLVARNIPWLPGILFGSLSIGVGLLALKLPETLNRPLPQTMEDIENWSKKKPDIIEEDNVKMSDISPNKENEMSPITEKA